MKYIKWLFIAVIVALVIAVAGATYIVRGSLPNLNAAVESRLLTSPAILSRDTMGMAVVSAENEYDSAYLLGYAHAQDRLFQMDLLRRQSAGELSAIVGMRALGIDRKHRFHQLKNNAIAMYEALPIHQQKLLNAYSNGVNEYVQTLSNMPLEYLMLDASFAPWQPYDSLMVTFSMYLDLQGNQIEIDYNLTALKNWYGDAMYQFFTQASNYQAAIDLSTITQANMTVPTLLPPTINSDMPQQASMTLQIHYDSIAELADIGSNNWAVASKLVQGNSAMLSNDMHLGLAVPAIWYKAQLNYTHNNKRIQVTGVSLPGVPAIIVGSTNKVAWGFTNANVDNVDWVLLDNTTETHTVTEQIEIADKPPVTYEIEMSEYGPVRTLNEQKYALKWVAHQNYALNVLVADMAKVENVDEALALSKSIRIPVQNMVVADANGDVAWQLTGAITRRAPLARHAISESQFSQQWQTPEPSPANHIKPENGRVWSANARVISTSDLAKFGDGGYALGARQKQIVDQLLNTDEFTENSFYALQLDNNALFLKPWHRLLTTTLSEKPNEYQQDLAHLAQWQQCACTDSVGYTLVRRFRSTVINQLIAPIANTFSKHQLSSAHLLRGIEPAIWQIIEQQPTSWLPANTNGYAAFYTQAYNDTKSALLAAHSPDTKDMEALTWGNVNMLRVVHPFASQLSFLADMFNMPEVAAFGDSYTPAVQGKDFGASQRLIVKPGNLTAAILTVPGGQSGHVLSEFYKLGFTDYAEHKSTPLLPGETVYSMQFTPKQ